MKLNKKEFLFDFMDNEVNIFVLFKAYREYSDKTIDNKLILT